MIQLYEKNKLAFTLVWIAAYVVLFSLADKISMAIGIQKVVTVPMGILCIMILATFLTRNKLAQEYGLCTFRGSYKAYLYFIPILLLLSVRLWNGITLNGSLLEVVLRIVSMFCVGFMEEMLFRGLLFRTMCEDNVKSAIIVSSITFGIGHLVNIINGSDVVITLLQVCYAMTIGLMLVMIFYKGKSLWPCILMHGVYNSLGAFTAPATRMQTLVASIALWVISLGYTLWIWKKVEFTSEAQQKRTKK